jgi:hypothetical protein
MKKKEEENKKRKGENCENHPL